MYVWQAGGRANLKKLPVNLGEVIEKDAVVPHTPSREKGAKSPVPSCTSQELGPLVQKEEGHSPPILKP